MARNRAAGRKGKAKKTNASITPSPINNIPAKKLKGKKLKKQSKGKSAVSLNASVEELSESKNSLIDKETGSPKFPDLVTESVNELEESEDSSREPSTEPSKSIELSPQVHIPKNSSVCSAEEAQASQPKQKSEPSPDISSEEKTPLQSKAQNIKRMSAIDCIESVESLTPVYQSTPEVSTKKRKRSGAAKDECVETTNTEDTQNFEDGFLGYENFDAYSNKLLPSVVNFLKSTRQLPSTKDEYDFYQSYPTFMTFSKNQGERVLRLIGKIFKHHHLYQAWNTTPANTVTGIEEQTEAVIEANDTLLERVDKIVDMIKQDIDRPKKLDIQQKSADNVLVAAWNTGGTTQSNKPIRLLHSKNIIRPQLRWKVKPDNGQHVFLPLIRHKPNARVPLQEEYMELVKREEEENNLSVFLKSMRGSDDLQYSYPHPYQFELEHFEPLSWQMELGLKQEPFEIKDTPLTVIDKVEQLESLFVKLKDAREVAIDLEAHSYRSFLGFTCLMQLSTRKEDFLIDTLSLRFDLHQLNEILTNPAILKVFHGGHNDILWLQRDLGLYVVNMFDTYHAAKQLSFPRCSLSYLMQRYCHVIPDKQYQLADWRIRPLPEVMIKYAREDTHYLLYIYDCLRYELIQKGMFSLETVYRNSCTECHGVFKKPVFTEDSYLDVYNKIRVSLKPQQKECLRLIYKWRDETARSEDESTAFVLPNHMLFKIAELLPHDQEGILACCNPPPPLVRLHVQEIHQLVEKSRHYNPLLDPRNATVTPGLDGEEEEEYTPGYLDTHHQQLIEYTPNISKSDSIFYVPRSGPDLKIKKVSDVQRKSDTISVSSETGSICTASSTIDFFTTHVITNEMSKAVNVVKESMAAPFRAFMSKIEQLKKEEDSAKVNEQVYPLGEPNVPAEPEPVKDEFNKDAIIFKQTNKRVESDETIKTQATSSKRFKKNVGNVKPFSYEEITMTSIAKAETVKASSKGEMLDSQEESRVSTIKQRTKLKSGNRSGFQNFLKKKFKR